jgi:hypothetical protein
MQRDMLSFPCLKSYGLPRPGCRHLDILIDCDSTALRPENGIK